MLISLFLAFFTIQNEFTGALPVVGAVSGAVKSAAETRAGKVVSGAVSGVSSAVVSGVSTAGHVAVASAGLARDGVVVGVASAVGSASAVGGAVSGAVSRMASSGAHRVPAATNARERGQSEVSRRSVDSAQGDIVSPRGSLDEHSALARRSHGSVNGGPRPSLSNEDQPRPSVTDEAPPPRLAYQLYR